MRPPRWWLPRTLRGRLIAGLVALLAIGCAIAGATTYLATGRSLADGLDRQLQTETRLWSACQAQAGDGDGDDHEVQPPANADGTGLHGSEWRAPLDQNPGAAPSADADSAADAAQAASMDCTGLATGTLQATVRQGRLATDIVGRGAVTLSAADQQALRGLPASQPPPPQAQPDQDAPIYTRTLSSAGGVYQLTAVSDTDGDSVCITGLPLSTMDDMLHELAIVELVVFGVVVALAGVLGTIWVRLSLRPLRRVAATASQVAELPLESGAVQLPTGVPDTDPRTETGQVGAAFNRMLGHVQMALARRNASETRLRRFAADASHELRTPLSAIRGYAELGLRHPGDSPEEVIHALSRVLSETTRMSVLVDDLLLLARLDAGRPLGREPVDMSRLAIDATSDARVARPDHRWMLELPDDPVMVRGDEHRLHQVLANLLSNAGRHTPAGTTVTVKVTTTAASSYQDEPDGTPPVGREHAKREPGKREPDENGPDENGPAPQRAVRRGVLPRMPSMVLTVTDDGPGIPPELLPDLFERFTRADTARSHVGDPSSTGLGLAIVDAVITAHKGAVTVTSRPGMTRFTIVLPRLEDPDSTQRRSRLPRKTLHRS